MREPESSILGWPVLTLTRIKELLQAGQPKAGDFCFERSYDDQVVYILQALFH